MVNYNIKEFYITYIAFYFDYKQIPDAFYANIIMKEV